MARMPAAVYAVGDIHGCLALYERLEAQIVADGAAFPGPKLIVCLGDMVDRGAASAGVIARMQQSPPDGFSRICLAGNHEDMMCRFLDDPQTHARWLDFGGAETLQSYGVAPGPRGDYRSDPQLDAKLTVAIPRSDRDFLRGLPLALDMGDLVFAHAGYDLDRTAQEQSEEHLLWGPPHACDSHTGPRRLVHGHVIVPQVTWSGPRLNLDLGAYMNGQLAAMRFAPSNDGEKMLLAAMS